MSIRATTTARRFAQLGFAAAITCVSAIACGAQTPTVAAEPGARIRVLRAGDRIPQEATLLSFDNDTLIMALDGCCIVDTIPRASLSAVDVSRGVGVSPGRVAGGIVFGGFAGVVAGWAVTEVGCSLPDSSELCGLGIAVWPVVLGAGGAVLGALWGMEPKVERWERIYPPTGASLLIAPTPHGGLAIGAAIPLDFGAPNRVASRE
ncbi:MAG TPA: hypothetical protein VIR34_17855 [Gemmatimonadaceae bacterium]|jgi:hypothetical protein